LALALALNSIGKKAVPYLTEPLPRNYNFLPGNDLFRCEKSIQIEDQILFVLDCGDITRTGIKFIPNQSPPFIINIDHHLSNTDFGAINLVDTTVSSTSELIFQLIERLTIPVTAQIAENIYTGILTDTGSFQYSNTTSETLYIAGKLISVGVKPERISLLVFNCKSKSYYRLLEMALNKMEFFCNDRIAFFIVTQEMLSHAGASL